MINAIGSSPVLYAVLSAVSLLFTLAFGVLGAGVLFRIRPRAHWLPVTAAVLLALAVGGMRPFAFSYSLNAVRIWNVSAMLVPFVGAVILYKGRAIWKAMLVAVGYNAVEALKYVLLLTLFGYDNENVNDPLELTVELALNVAAVLLLLWLLMRRGKKSEQPLVVTRSGVILYLLVIATLVVFVSSLALLGSAYSEEEHAQFAFTLLNIPLFAATVAYAVWSLSRSRQQEKNYRIRLDQQIRHYEMMEQMNEDLRTFRHDLPKLMRPFADYVENDRPDEAKEIARRFSGFLSEQGARFNTGNYRLDTVLFCQQQMAEKDGVKINWTFGSVFPAEGVAPDDIYTIFPNALDNATEACRRVGGPCEITITSRIRGNEVLVTVSNPVAGPVSSSGGVPRTDKRDRRLHGYGFRSMKKAAAKYGDDNLDFLVEDGKFILRMNLTFRQEEEKDGRSPG